MKLLKKLNYENSRSYAFRVLLTNIIHLDLEPGATLSENEISTTLQLSRTPVREAFIELEKLKLIEILPQRGSRVSKINFESIEDAQFMRIVLETAILKIICDGLPNNRLQSLKENLQLQKEAITQNNNHQFFELDNTFHQLLFDAAGKKRIQEFMQPQMYHFDRFRNLLLKNGSYTHDLKDHQDLIQFIELHDFHSAKTKLESHLTKFYPLLQELLVNYPNYFNN